MFDPPLEAVYIWFGLGIVSVCVLGIVLGFPTAAPPEAGPVADSIDRVASSQQEPQIALELDARAIRLRPRSVALRTDGGTARASLAFGPITPALNGSLARILAGKPPERVFRSKLAFGRALATARSRSYGWRPAPAELTVRRVSWEGIDATLVG